jgi:Flp pilus assembly protein TadD
MTGILARLWWWMRVGALRIRGWVLRRDEGQAILDLGCEAARRYDFAAFFRAVDWAGGVSRWGPQTLAWCSLPYYDGGRKQQAGRLITAALEMAPKDAVVLGCYGKYLQNEGRFRESIEYLERALAGRPNNPWILSLLGQAWRCLGKWEEARKYYLDAMRQDPDEDLAGVVNSGLAHVAAQLGDWSEAARCWRKAAMRRSWDEEIWYNLGDALLHVGDYHGAIKALKKNLRLGCEQPAWSYYDMARCYQQLGDIRLARAYCEKAFECAPNDEAAIELKKELEQVK